MSELLLEVGTWKNLENAYEKHSQAIREIRIYNETGNNIDNCTDIIVYFPYEISKVKNLTPEFCMELVKKDPSILIDIPAECQTEDVCMECVRKDKYTFQYIKPERLTRPILHYLLDDQSTNIGVFRECQIKAIPNDMWISLIKKTPSMVTYSPMTRDLIMLALSVDPCSMFCIPKEYQTEDIISEWIDIIDSRFMLNYIKDDGFKYKYTLIYDERKSKEKEIADEQPKDHTDTEIHDFERNAHKILSDVIEKNVKRNRRLEAISLIEGIVILTGAAIVVRKKLLK